MKYILAAFIGISFAALLSACSFMPPPLNDPHVSTFGKKCNEEVWSYIWITKRGEDLTASEENCKIPIKK